MGAPALLSPAMLIPLARRQRLPELMDQPGLDPAEHQRALAGLRRAAAPGPWLALAFGPGLTVEAALLDTPER